MPLNVEAHVAKPSTSAEADAGAVAQVPQVSHNNYTPSTLIYNINLPPDQPSNLRIIINAPPSYEVAIDCNATPPSYESLIGQMREVHKSRNFKNLLILFLGIIRKTIFLGVEIGLPLCMMIIGGIYLYDCPQSEYIPVFLLVIGGFDILIKLFQLCVRLRQDQEEQDQEQIRQSSVQTLICCFNVGWFIIGSVWVYKEYEPNYDPALGKYCNKTLYLFAFWYITIIYIYLAVSIVCLYLSVVLFRYF